MTMLSHVLRRFAERSTAGRRRSAHRRPPARRLQLEPLEQRTLLAVGTIAGTVFDDLDADGVFETGEPALEGVTVYLDQNQNGSLDASEASARTNPDGDYQFTGLDAGTYYVAPLARVGWEQTMPLDPAWHEIAITEGAVSSDNDFGLKKVGPLYADGPEFRVNATLEGTQTTYYLPKSVAMDKQGNSVVVWHGNGPGDDAGVFAQRFNANGDPLGQEFRVNTTTEETQGWPVVAMAGDTGSFTIAWTMQIPHPTSENTVYCRTYDANGVPLTDELQIASDYYLTSALSIATDDSGNFAVLYRLDPGSHQLCSFYVHRYNAQGEPLGGPIRIARTSLANGFGAIAMNDDGDFVVTWDDGDDGAVHAQPFNSSGQKVGKPIVVASSGWASNVAMDAAGNFAATWDDRTTGTMRCRLFGADGTPKGEPFSIDGGHQTAMTMQANGNFALAWNIQLKPDPDDPQTWHRDVYAQRFDANGNQMADPFLVNSTFAGHQTGASVAANASGDLMVAWSGNGPGDDQGVFAQRFSVMPTPGITVSPASGLVTSEDHESDTFTVQLDTQPAQPVTVGISSRDTSEGTVSPAMLTFDSINWATPKLVTVTGADDGDVDGDVVYAIRLDPSGSSDPDYALLTLADVSATNLDNDGPTDPTVFTSTDTPLGIADAHPVKGGRTTTSQLEVTTHDAIATLGLEISIDDGMTDVTDLGVMVTSPEGTPVTITPVSGVNTLDFSFEFGGEDPYGTWTLEITDFVKGNVHTLNQWSLTLNESIQAAGASADLALLTWLEPDSSDDDGTDPLTESLVDDLALMLME